MVRFEIKNILGIPNQFEIQLPQGTIFQSYKSYCAARVFNRKVTKLAYETQMRNPNWNGVVLGPHWDYSKTTGKYRNIFLGEDRKTTQRKIDSGEYLVVDDVLPFLFEAE